MDRQLMLRRYRNDKIVLSKVLDKYQRCDRNYEISFTTFVDPGNLTAIVELLTPEISSSSVQMLTYGGSEDCERKMIGFFPDYLELTQESSYKFFPIDCLKADFTSRFKTLSHRDFLGSLISLGIDRSKLGDIFVFERFAVIFVSKDVSGFICSSFTKAGNIGITIAHADDSYFHIYQKTGVFKTVRVASLRLDGIISATFNVSRGIASDHIGRGKVFVNWISVTKSSHLINNRDVISLRGYGRAVIQEICENKDKFTLTIMINQ